MKRVLIVYYSWSNGNTKKIAERLHGEVGGDLVRINTLVPYAGSYEDVVEQGQEEVRRGYEPELQPLDVSISDYDVLVLGTPTWWYTMAPAMRTFLHSHRFEGKTVVPFMTNGGWPGHVLLDMKAACEGASFACEKEIQFDFEGGSRLVTPPEEVDQWIRCVKDLL